MHEALVGAGDPEGREVALDAPTVIHQGVRVGGSVGVAVDEVLQAQVADQSLVPGVGEMSASVPWAGSSLWIPARASG